MQLNSPPPARIEAAAVIEGIRSASRQLVRQLGFMGSGLAGTRLPPSAVHALIEVGGRPGIAARDLGELLCLDKSSVSRMLRKLVASGEIEEREDAKDGRAKRLFLTAAGRERVMAIHAFGSQQVRAALSRLRPGDDQAVLRGLRLYGEALAGRDDADRPASIEVETGYRPGLIARITQMHALHYARTSGFGQRFESVVAGGLADFCDRLDNPSNQVWTACRGGEVVGSIAIDGEDLGRGVAHLRWFIMDDRVRGGGIGRTLLASALAFADGRNFEETQLWTFSGLEAARHLYEAHGFVCIEEYPGDRWGRDVLEQRFVRLRP